MADEEHFSLCWNNFNTNLSTGFHESLCRGDLVDVTLVAEGQMVKAHRLVLSVCSPLFREMFAAMQPNQQAFVVLPNITHSALEDLITFIYCGEVNVKNEALSTFISTAESLQIKGLTDNDAPTKTEQSSDIMQAQVITVNAPAPVAQAAPVRQQTRTVTRPATVAAPVAPAPKPRVSRQTTVESEESGAEEVVRVPAAVAAPAKRASGPAPKSVAVKRIKINAASTPTQTPSTTTTTLAKRTAQPIPKPAEIVKTEQVLIELPMDQSAAEDEVEEEVHEDEPPQETEEDESYAKYDETYFTVNETATSDTKEISTANTTGGTSFCVEDTQDLIGTEAQMFIQSRKGGIHLVHNDFVYRSNLKLQGKQKNIIYWECVRNRDIRCRARLKSVGDSLYLTNMNTDHNHESEEARIELADRKKLICCKWLSELGRPTSKKD